MAGDSHLKPFVTAEPEVTVTEREEGDECLILASDGLWDVVTNEMACEVVRTCLGSNEPVRGEEEDIARASDKACSDAALLLTKLALARRSSDNVSVVVVNLRRNF
jgi:protein phosphatase 2C